MNDFIGFQRIIEGFSIRARKNKLSHAHLIVGPEGIGKSILAKIFAHKILGKDDDRDYVDIINYRLKKASFGVDEVRNIIQEVNKKPYEGDKKVIIIHNGDKLTMQAQNTLLKTIEEPPMGVYIIILSESLQVMLDTIKSRCQVYKLSPLSNNEIQEYIDKNLADINEQEKKLAIAFSKGIPGRAIKVIKDKKLSKLRDTITHILLDINEDKNNIVLNYEDKLVEYKEEKEEMLNILLSFIRDILVYRETRNANSIINVDKYSDIIKLSDELSFKKLYSMIDNINSTRKNILSNSNYSMSVSVMLMGFMEVK